jgi:hypothetical protein
MNYKVRMQYVEKMTQAAIEGRTIIGYYHGKPVYAPAIPYPLVRRADGKLVDMNKPGCPEVGDEKTR